MEAIPGHLPAEERLLLPGLGRKAPVIAQLGGSARHLLIQLCLKALHELGLQGGQCLGIDVPGWRGGLGVRALGLLRWRPGAGLLALPGGWRGRGQDRSPWGAVSPYVPGRGPAGSL